MPATLTSNEVINELGLSRSTFYNLIKTKKINLETTSNGRYVWNEAVFSTIKSQIMEMKRKKEIIIPTYSTTLINNRRYLGNKYKLLDFIKDVIDKNCNGINVVADIFAGTGAVASAFLEKMIIANDMLYFNYICNLAWFDSEKYDKDKIINYIEKYNTLKNIKDNYMSINFADTFFSLEDCKKIGYIRDDIEKEFKKKNINNRERALLITSLIYAMDKIANTCGHYDAYRQSKIFEKHLELSVPLASNNNNINNKCYNEDANALVKRIEADLIYIDPPYNSRQYCDAYHLLENVARWQKPKVDGVAKKMDRTMLKSEYCTKSATTAFEDLIKNCKAKYILLSYNNMAEKGNDRSNAKISDDDIMRILSAKGDVKVFSKDYKAFTTGKSEHQENEERLFLCTCCENSIKKLIQSPLNYIGGKYKLLPQILPHFPKDINNFVDLFCGGCNVGINVNCNRVVFNDNNSLLRLMFSAFKQLDKEIVFETIDNIIERYGLTNTSKYGYDYYGCNSYDGLANCNKDAFLRLRNDFNKKAKLEYDYYLILYVLIVFAFNNQIRFNSKGEFNLPVGKRDFNSKMRKKLSDFIDRIKSSDYTFESVDFRELNNTGWNEYTFVYVDPPYLISHATYNEKDGWNEELEKALLDYLYNLNARGIRFALSNVLRSKGKVNQILLDWMENNNYRKIDLNYSYSNSNYQVKDKKSETEEILIVNYLKEERR